MYNGKWVENWIKSKEKRSGLKPPFKELSHGKLFMRKQQNLLSWLVIYKNKAKQLPYRCINPFSYIMRININLNYHLSYQLCTILGISELLHDSGLITALTSSSTRQCLEDDLSLLPMVGMTLWINDDYFILILQDALKVVQVPILESHSRAEQAFSFSFLNIYLCPPSQLDLVWKTWVCPSFL
jgi:hypothetical protein